MTFSILASQLKRFLMWFWKKIGLRPIFTSKISDAKEMRVYRAIVETIAALGLKSVRMTPSLCRKSTREFQYMGDNSLSHLHFSD